jgi:P4 family phage/plasmid primase-like protien
MSLLEAALDYDSRGWRIIPLHRVGGELKSCSCNKGLACTSKGKHPKDLKWQDSPRLSVVDIHGYWDDSKPPNLGIATGTISGFWVLDIDPKGGGLETMANLVEAHGKLPETFVVQTGSGGYHYYFLLPDFIVKNDQSGHAGPGVDVRGEGGQVVAAPSITDKGDYVVVKDAPVATAPQWVLDLVYKADKSTGEVVTAEDLPKPEDIAPAEWDRLNRYAHKAVDANLKRLDKMQADSTPNASDYRGEPWNHTTFEVACALTEIANSPWNAYSHGHVRRDLLAHAPRDREFDDHIVLKCLESATSRVGDKARAVPENKQAEVDPLMSGPDVIDRTSGPTEGAGAEAAPGVGGAGPWRFFGGDRGNEPLYDVLGQAVLDLGPLGWGADESWWAYENGVWRPDPKVIRRRVSRLLQGKVRRGHALECAEHLQFLPELPFVSGDPVPDFMNFRNGMVDWRSGDVMEHSERYLSTVQFPINWDPEATCPNFDRFLADVMHEDYVDLAWEMIGYLMYSGNPLQVAFLLYGSGGNGKGTLVRVIEAILGTQNIGNEPLDRLNNDRFSSINLFSKIANIAGDIDATYQESTANFKRLTGEDTLAAERKFGDRFVFENWAVPLFSANKIPGSADVSEGYLRRWIVLHFHKRITNPTPGLSNLLEYEVEGIAYKAVTALRELMMRNKFEPKGKAVEAKEEFAESIDQVRQWIASHDTVSAPGEHVKLRDLYNGYLAWAQATNRGKINENEFAHRLESVGIERHDQGDSTVFVGIKPRVYSNAAVEPFIFE